MENVTVREIQEQGFDLSDEMQVIDDGAGTEKAYPVYVNPATKEKLVYDEGNGKVIRRINAGAAQEAPGSKLREIIKSGYENTERVYKIRRGEFKGMELPVYARPGDVAGIVYNPETDKVEMIYKLMVPFEGKKPDKG